MVPLTGPPRGLALLLLAAALVGLAPGAASAQGVDSTQTPLLDTSAPDTTVDPDVPFVRTPERIVNRMLELANVSEDDVVYDLGSGDGRIPITAAQRYGARGVGIEIQPGLVQKARRKAETAGVADQVEFRQQDLFRADISDATVVTLYLLPDVNTKLRPMLFEQLAPGTRVVSHGFDMDEWTPDQVIQVDNTYLYLWTIPKTIPDSLRSQ
ncbi:MAG: cyclopropane-fatty-acyl-phospholipid synthase family protein [Salinibacter sp.]